MFAAVGVEPWQTAAGIAVILAAIVGVVRQFDVRFVLFAAALAMGLIAGQVDAIVRKFLATFSDERFVVPICSAMGFSYVLRQTGCDQHLVKLLMRPLVAVRAILIPGAVVVGYLVNMPVVSQASTALAVGPVLIPVLKAARIPVVVIASALLLGSSIGGELFNPGAPELRTVVVESNRAAAELGLVDVEFTTAHCIRRLRPLNLLGLAVATSLFWWRSRSIGTASAADAESDVADLSAVVDLRVNLPQALAPLVPLALLAIFAPGVGLVEVLAEWSPTLGEFRLPRSWLEDSEGQFETRLIGAAMLVGVAAAVATRPSKIAGAAEAFFQGAGFGFANIVSIIVAANCFGRGLEAIGVARLITDHLAADGRVLIVAAGLASLGFAFLCGSGMATAQSLFPFFAVSALRLGLDPTHVGAVVSLAAAAGRTMSPLAAVNQMCARLTDTRATDLTRVVAPPVLAAVASFIAAAVVFR